MPVREAQDEIVTKVGHMLAVNVSQCRFLESRCMETQEGDVTLGSRGETGSQGVSGYRRLYFVYLSFCLDINC